MRLALIGVSGLAFALALVFALFAWRAAAASDRQLHELNEIANTDGLTGIMNRRRLDEMLPIELARAQRTGYSLSVAMLDIDYFKRFNDKRGHVAGDRLLQAAAQAWRQQMRPTDLPAANRRCN